VTLYFSDLYASNLSTATKHNKWKNPFNRQDIFPNWDEKIVTHITREKRKGGTRPQNKVVSPPVSDAIKYKRVQKRGFDNFDGIKIGRA
jgi:hypothetical protein